MEPMAMHVWTAHLARTDVQQTVVRDRMFDLTMSFKKPRQFPKNKLPNKNP